MSMHRLFVLLLIVSCKSESHDAPPPASTSQPEPVVPAPIDPNDPFAPYPNSAELCNRLIIAGGKPLHWRSWAITDDFAKVTTYYKDRAKAMQVKESTEKVEIQQSPARILTIYPAALAKQNPQCNKPLDPQDKTVVMLSEISMPQ